MEIQIYEVDYDEFDRQENLYADGVVIRSPKPDRERFWEIIDAA